MELKLDLLVACKNTIEVYNKGQKNEG